MRIVFVLSEHPLHNRIVTDLMRARPRDEVAIVKVPLVLKGKSRTASAQRILPQLSRRFLCGKILEGLALRLLPLLPPRRRGPALVRLRRLARRRGLPFHRTANIMSGESLAFVRDQRPDVVVTLFHQIVKRPLIELPRLGVVNVHPGLLPGMGGIQPYFWALAEGAPRAGATLHLIEDETIDTGSLLARSSFAVQPGMSVQLTYYLSALAGARLLPGCLDALESGRSASVPQAPGEGAYFRWPDSSAYDRLWARGHTLFSLRQLLEILYGRWESTPFAQDLGRCDREVDRVEPRLAAG